MFTFLLFIKIKDKFVLSCLNNTPFGLRVTYWACFSFCMFTNDFLCIQSNSHFFAKKRDPIGEALGLKSCKKLHALKNKLHRQHTAHRSRRDRQEHIALVNRFDFMFFARRATKNARKRFLYYTARARRLSTSEKRRNRGDFRMRKKSVRTIINEQEKENFGQGGILPCGKKRFCGNRDEPFRSMRGRMSACAGEAAPVFLPPCARLGSAVRSFYAKKPIFWAERRRGHFCERAVRLCKNTSTRERTQKVYGNNGNNFEKTRFFV